MDFNSYYKLITDLNTSIQKGSFLYTSLLINELSDKFNNIRRQLLSKNQQTGCYYNPLFFIPIGETIHSKILGDFLNPNGTHGQGDLFLLAFLGRLGIYNPTEGSWHVTVELGRIDILLVRDNPKSVVVVENKSNDAVDQSSQLYRYWYQEVYRRFYSLEAHSDRAKILYLPSYQEKDPSSTSLLRPKSLDGVKGLPKKMPLNYVKWSFSTEIIELLSDTYEMIPTSNKRLKEFIKLYIDLWT